VARDAWGRPVSPDGLWFWDGGDWQPRYGTQIGQAGPGAKPSGAPGTFRPRRTSLIRATVALVLAGLLVVGGLQLTNANWLAGQTESLTLHHSQIAAGESEMADLASSWTGSPALWQPPPISNTDFKFYTVTGITQQDLLSSMEAANICHKFGGCAPDPAAPAGFALGLESFHPVGTYYTCYSPSTTTVPFWEEIVLPRWSPPADGSVKIAVVEAWNALEQVVYTHEAGHVAITKQDLKALNRQAQHLSSCQALFAFWNKPTIFNKEAADQLAYHARLRADCRPEVGCLPSGWMGW
jgi:predicted secreted Zn-dependent protease